MRRTSLTLTALAAAACLTLAACSGSSKNASATPSAQASPTLTRSIIDCAQEAGTIETDSEALPAIGGDAGGVGAGVALDDLFQGRLRLAHLATVNPYTLSGGEKRRLSVATMLATASYLGMLGALVERLETSGRADDLLTATYAEIRRQPNVVLCVGGGIGTPERASEYLTGEWATRHGYPTMPLDGILIGTAAMATAAATPKSRVRMWSCPLIS